MRTLRRLGIVAAGLLIGACDRQNTILTDNTQLEAPSSLFSVSLDSAIALSWTDNSYLDDPTHFQWYRVYSASYSLDTQVCGTDWAIEGETVSPEFIAGALTNGVSRCFAVSAIATNGNESVWSPLRQDTPRYDARNVLLFPRAVDSAAAGFRFWDGGTGFGLVQDGSLSTVDFYLYQDPSDSSMWIVPAFSGTSVQVYGSAPVADLTSIDFAPDTGYTRNMIEAQPGYGYVFQIVEGATVRYGALRMTHVGRGFVIFDWSFQTDPGNPELVLRAGRAVATATGGTVTARP